jgi:hypothetical protein
MARSFANLFRRRFLKPTSRTPFRRNSRPILELLEDRVVPANVDVLSYHYNLLLTGQNLQETTLTPANVNATNFGVLFNQPIDGQAYAQPLYKTNVMIGGVAHNVAFIATEHDSIYAFDADTGAQLWHNSYIDPANGITTTPYAELSTPDLFPEIGITSTGVIDAGTSTLYEVVKTKEVGRGDGRVHYVQKLHALDLATGAEKFGGPYQIGDTSVASAGATPVFANETTAIVVAGVGGESSGGANPLVPFSAEKENVRMSLQLVGNIVYVAFASHADFRPYHGWVIGFDKTTLQPTKVFNTAPNADGVAIWESGGGLSFDAQGFMYFAVGNGFQLAGGFSPFDPAHGNYSESVLKIDTTPNWSPSNPQMMRVADYFTPFNWQQLDSQDADLGSGGVLLLPDSVGSDAHRHLMIETGKQGVIYLIDRDNMGGFTSGGPDQVVQRVTAGQAGVWGNPAFYQTGPNSGIIYYHGSNDVLKGYRITNGHMDDVSADILRSTFNSIFPGTQPTVSADGTADPLNPVNGIVWELQVDNAVGRIQGAADNQTAGPATLRAFIANPTGTTFTELYDSAQTGQRDFSTGSVKFTVPVVTNGHVLVAGADHFAVFGLFPAATAAPAAPSMLSGQGRTTPTGPQIQLSWTNPTPNPGSDPTGIKIFRSTDGGTTFTQIDTVSRNLTTYTDVGPFQFGQMVSYRLVATNQVGDSGVSNTVSVQAPLPPAALTVTGTGASSVSLSWVSVANDHFVIERSTDGVNFSPVATVPAFQTSYTDTGLTVPGLYDYRIHAFNANPTADSLSNVQGAWIGSMIDHSTPATGGFTNTTDLTLNGSAFVTTNLLELTNAPGQAGSAFSNNRFTIANFTSTFDVRLHEGTQPNYADGFAFVLQANSPTALGSAAAGIGYQGVGHSVALVFNTFQHTGEPSTTSVGLAINGAAAGNVVDTTSSGLLLNSQDAKQIDLTYDGTSLTVRIQDILQPQLVFTTSFAVNIPQVIGSDTAYVGLTGGSGSGGFWELEDVLSWKFTSQAPVPGAPSNLRVSAFASQSIDLAWNGNSFNETAFQVERSMDGTNFTQVATTAVPSYRDLGLVPGTYYYRVRAVNAAGNSPYSNVTIPTNLPASIPPILTLHQDIGTAGNPSVAGNATFSNGVYTVTGSGSDIWDTADHMQYLYTPFTGDGQIIARVVTEQAGVNDFAKAGVMFRESLGADSANAYTLEFPSPGSRAYPVFQWRPSTGASTGDNNESGRVPTPAPIWVRVDRNGNTFSGYYALDMNGTPGPWVLLQTQTFSMRSTIFAGLAVTSHNNGATVTATFDHVQILPAVELTSHLDVNAAAFAVNPGTPVSITVKALDQLNNVVTTYRGTVHFTSSDMMAGLPADYTFTDTDNGVHTFTTTTLQTLGRQTVTVTDTAANTLGGGTALTVTNAVIPSSLVVAGFPSPIVPGVQGSFTVTVRDAMGNPLTGYLGTVHLTSSDATAAFANNDGTALAGNNYTFTAADMGMHTFRATLNTPGTQSLTVADPTLGVSGSQSGIQVATQPSITSVSRSASVINLGGTLTVSGTFTDLTPGQTHQLVVNWGDNTANTTLSLAAGVFTFSTGHAYMQMGNFGIQVTVTGAAGLSDMDVLPATATAVVPPANLVGWWTGDGNNPTTAPDLAGTNGGTLNGGVTYVPGEVGKAFSFDGNPNRGSYVNIPNAPSLNSTTGTWSFWLKTTQTDGFVGLVGKSDAAGSVNGITMQLDGGHARVEVKANGPTTLLTGTTTLSDGQWHLMTLTFQSGGPVVLYIDGRTETSGTAPTFTFNPNPLRFGVMTDGFWTPYNGLLDEVQIYNRTLSASEIQSIFNAGAAGQLKGVRVQGAPAITNVSRSAAAINEGGTIGVSGAFTDPVAGQTHQLIVSWGDGSANTTLPLAAGVFTFSTNHQYLEEGNFTIRVTVQAANGGSDTVTFPVTPAGLVSWWSGEGNANDVADNNPGTLNGNVTFTSGKTGKAFNFDGNRGSFVNVPNASSLNSNTGTWSFWLKTTQTSGFVGLVGKHDASSSVNGITMQLDGGHARVEVKSGNQTTLLTGTTTLSDGQWHLMTLTFQSGGPVVLYIDGRTETSGTAPTFTFNATPLRFGVMLDTFWTPYNGLLDDVQIYNRVLSASEVQAIYNPVAVAPPANLVGWWTGDGNNPTTAPDIAGINGGTLNGGVTYTPGEVGNAFSFNGAGDRSNYVNIPDAPSLNSTTGTWDFWFKSTQTNVYVGLVGKSDSFGSLNGITMQIGPDGHARVEVKGNDFPQTALLNGTTAVNDGQWHHMALTFQSGGQTILYVDGQRQDSQAVPSTFNFGANDPLRFGTMTDTFWTPLNGQLDEVQIYNRVLSAAEVLSIFNAGSNGLTKGVHANDVAVVPIGGFTVTTGVGVVPAPQMVAAFFDPAGAEGLSDYSATIDWGDNTAPSAGTISGTSAFTVQGSHSYAAAGRYTVTVTIHHDTAPDVTAISMAEVFAPVLRFGSAFPSPTVAGTPGSFTITVQDPFGATLTGYRGTVHFTSSDGQAMLPADYTFTDADAGMHMFSATLKTAGTQSLTATDTATSSTVSQTGIVVTPAAASSFVVSASPTTVTAGSGTAVTVTAKDAFGNVATGYTGTVHFTSTDGQAMLPGDTTLTSGTGIFVATLKTAGTQSITATDTVNSSLTSTQSGIVVTPAAASSFVVAASPTPITAGDSTAVTVTAYDAYGNVATGYTGTVHLSSSDGQAVLPADYIFMAADLGTHTFGPATLKTAGSQSITATDTVNSLLTGIAAVTVNPAAATHLALTFPSTITRDQPYNLIVTALDAYGNVATGYTGTVHFSSSDDNPNVNLPDDYTFTAADGGTHTFSGVSLHNHGQQSITATDTLAASIFGTIDVLVQNPGGQ